MEHGPHPSSPAAVLLVNDRFPEYDIEWSCSMTAQNAPTKNLSYDNESAGVPLVPRINIHAFCELPQTYEAIRTAFADRRMSRAHGTIAAGGITAAVKRYESQSTPNLLMVESNAPRETLLSQLSSLAEVCQPDTKVVVLGHANDVILYRDLIKQGVSEYIVAPFMPLQLIEAVDSLYRSEKSSPIGRVIAFIGAKGGTGSSTLSHNCAWEIARICDIETTIIDLDLAFGTAALNFNLDAAGGILEAIAQPERVDSLLLDRLLVKLGDRLTLLGGQGGVDKDFTVEAHAVETVLLAMRLSVPMIIVDLPNLWAPWVRYTLLHADQVVVVAEPELASLRNARELLDLLVAARPNDPPPAVVLNQLDVPKRPEIPAIEFRKAIGVDVVATIPFDPQNFGAALNNGRMLLDFAPRSKAANALRMLSQKIAGDRIRKPQASRESILNKLLVLGRK